MDARYGEFFDSAAPSVAKPCADEYDPPVYADWLRGQFNIEVGPIEEDFFENIIQSLAHGLEQSTFWKHLGSAIYAADVASEMLKGERLLVSRAELLKIGPKGYQSALLKSWRRNVLDHDTKWPSEPSRGWLTPVNWYTRMSDLLRTQVLVKYLDGVPTIRDLILQVAQDHDLQGTASPEARDEGYYAVHVNLMMPLRFPDGRGTETVPVEIQVSTQVKDVIQRLTHQLYEDRRRKPPDTVPWQWNFKDEEFTINYLGHILHYIEGTIMRLRRGQET